MPRKGTAAAARESALARHRHQYGRSAVPDRGRAYATTITESRLLDLVKHGKIGRDAYMLGARAGTAVRTAYHMWFTYRAAGLWRLTPTRHAVAWIDGGTEGVTLYTEYAHAVDSYTRVCVALAELPHW